jgi:hypothetical protein
MLNKINEDGSFVKYNGKIPSLNRFYTVYVGKKCHIYWPKRDEWRLID